MEHRRHTRVNAQKRICITVLPQHSDNSATETFCCTTDDLSEDGLRFSGAAAFKEGDRLAMLVIHGSSYRGFEVKGRVVWVRKDPRTSTSSFGIEFTEMSAATRLAWQDALERDRGRPAPGASQAPRDGREPLLR